MGKPRFLYCATDKEIYDALASAPLHFSEATLLELAKKSGGFFSLHRQSECSFAVIFLCSYSASMK